jgi:hypothetical protein
MRTPRPWSLPTEPATTAVLAAGGVTGEMLTTRLRRGELVRVRRGVYLASVAWPDDPDEQHLVRAHAEAAANPEAVISHESAAVFWRLPYPGFGAWAENPVSVSFPADAGGRSSPQAVRHHVERLPIDHVARDDRGYAVTTVARTAVDLACAAPLPEALVLLDAAARALCRRFVAQPRRSDYGNHRLVAAARERLSEVATALGHPRLVDVVGLVDPARESVAESLSAGHFHLAGLPVPQFNPPLRTRAGVLFPDCLWAEESLIGECDGAVKYGDAAAIMREKEREQVLRDLDYRMVRWLAREIMTSPAVVVERVRRALGD